MIGDDKDLLPPLIPLKKKQFEVQHAITPSEKSLVINTENSANLMKEIAKNTPTNLQLKDSEKMYSPAKKQINPQKMREIEQRGLEKITNLPKRDLIQKNENQRPKQNEKMKFLIAQMLNSISAKNTAEELYPVSNQILLYEIVKIEDSIDHLKNEAVSLQNSLELNPNNVESRNQLESTKRRVNRCYLIKELYSEQGEFLVKIKQLEEKVLALQAENTDMKKKVGRGIQTIQGYKHNIPCRRHKELREELKNKQKELSEVREMRLELEKEAVAISFKKLYDDADATRLTVTKKLREIDERNKKLKKLKSQEEQLESQEINSLEILQKKQDKKISSLHSLEIKQQNNQKKIAENDNSRKQVSSYRQKMILGPQTTEKEEKKVPVNSSMTMEQKINRMRSNQSVLARALPNFNL